MSNSLLIGFALLALAAASPAPISVSPSGEWDGVDGSWSTFDLRVGAPAQNVRVFASWQSYQTWVVLPQGCPDRTTSTACTADRGGAFNPNSSTTWNNHGFFGLTIEESLDLSGNANFGFDAVGLTNETAGPTVKNSTVGALAVNDYYLGIFGLDPKPTNWTSFTDSSPSYMTLMKEQDLIPSISFGYTAGAKYRDEHGSLTLGGYDDSRSIGDAVEFSFGSDNSRYTLVNLQSITASPKSGTDSAVLLTTPILTLVDTTVAELWLPIDVCKTFEIEFGLVYDETSGLYLVDDNLHASLLARNANITLTLATQSSGGSAVDITLPYAALDLMAYPPYASLSNSSRYFPLRRANNDTQYTLGRTLMQEAYISIDYSRSKFNMSQVVHGSPSESNIVPITQAQAMPQPSMTTTTDSSPLSSSAIAGIAVGLAAFIGLVVAFLVWYFRRRQHRKRLRSVLLPPGEKHPSRRDTLSNHSNHSDDSRMQSDADGMRDRGTTRIFPRYADSDTGRSPVSEDKLLSPYPTSSISSPQTPFSGCDRGRLYSFADSPKSATADLSPATPSPAELRSPLGPRAVARVESAGSFHGSDASSSIVRQSSPVIWAGEADSDQVFEMPGSEPGHAHTHTQAQVHQLDGKQISPSRSSPLRSWNTTMSSTTVPHSTVRVSGAGSPLRTSRAPSATANETSSLKSIHSSGMRSELSGESVKSSMAATSAAAPPPRAIATTSGRYAGPLIPPKLNVAPAAQRMREVMSPVSALTPASRRIMARFGDGNTMPRQVAIDEESPVSASTHINLKGPGMELPRTRRVEYGNGDDEEYQSPAF